jgi:hypothetical protein
LESLMPLARNLNINRKTKNYATIESPRRNKYQSPYS